MNLKHCEIVTDADKLKVDIQEVCNLYSSIKQWAYILHDKDDTRPHYHIYLNFGNNSIDTEMVARWFNIEENFVSRIKGRKVDILKYLTHGNESQKNKHRYDNSEVIANFDFQCEIEQDSMLGDFEKYSYAQQISYVHSLDLEFREKAFKKLENLWRLECKYQAQKTDRDIKVVFITGESGSGKTSFAKEMLNKLNYDYCVSSSNNDVFQDYQGQKAIILDDLRDSTFSLTDLLKVLDNNTNSSVKSRFNNKVFNGKIIIITSCKPLSEWYNSSESKVANESLMQLYRRISSYIKVTKDLIYITEKIDDKGCPDMSFAKQMPNIIKVLYGNKKESADNLSTKLYEMFKSDNRFSNSFKGLELVDNFGLKYIDDDDSYDLPF